MALAHVDALASQEPLQHPRTHGGVFQVRLIDTTNQRQVLLAGGAGSVVHQATTDIEQLGLARHAQGVITVGHRFALSNPALVSALSKNRTPALTGQYWRAAAPAPLAQVLTRRPEDLLFIEKLLLA